MEEGLGEQWFMSSVYGVDYHLIFSSFSSSSPPIAIPFHLCSYRYSSSSLLPSSPVLLLSFPSFPCPPTPSLSVTFDSQASCHMWLERLRKVICGAKDLDKTFAFVHWAYVKDQQAMKELETKASSTFEYQHSFKAGHLPAVEGMRHRLECRCLVNVCKYYHVDDGTYTSVPLAVPVTVLPLS